MGLQYSGPSPAGHDVVVTTYEHLAEAIIANRKAEESLVKGILLSHYAMARRHLRAAVETAGGDRVSYLESAAAQISNIANEGDKPVQAVRQRLLKAGHHHHTDAETQADYIFVDSGEKKELLAMAREVSGIGGDGTEQQIRAAQRELTSLFDRVIAPE
jgi:hypothetical protein